LDTLTDLGYIWMGVFLSILVVGFAYEWKSSMLEMLK
jgi:NADH:ubiquinone oxidoreductase subunit 3 (subunit A)